MLTADMKRLVAEQPLGFVATVSPDGTPNLSPKGTFAVIDDRTLAFADIRSPQTIRNLRANPRLEVLGPVHELAFGDGGRLGELVSERLTSHV